LRTIHLQHQALPNVQRLEEALLSQVAAKASLSQISLQCRVANLRCRAKE
jgi:hypothetical protein